MAMSEQGQGHTEWVPPAEPASGGRRKLRRVALIAGVIVGALLVGSIGLSFLGAQVLDTLRGTIEFGTGGSGCTVQGRASSFPSSTAIYSVGYFTRELPAGGVVTVVLTQDGIAIGSREETVDVAADCIAWSLPPASLTPAGYRLDYVVGSEALATGEFTITSE